MQFGGCRVLCLESFLELGVRAVARCRLAESISDDRLARGPRNLLFVLERGDARLGELDGAARVGNRRALGVERRLQLGLGALAPGECLAHVRQFRGDLVVNLARRGTFGFELLLRVRGRALEVSRDRLLSRHLRFQLLAAALECCLELLARCEELGLLLDFLMGLIRHPAEVSADRTLLFERGVGRPQCRLGRFHGSLRGRAELGGLLVRLRLDREARLGRRGLRLFGGDAREIQNQAGERLAAGRIGQHVFKRGQPAFERFAQDGKLLLSGIGQLDGIRLGRHGLTCYRREADNSMRTGRATAANL